MIARWYSREKTKATVASEGRVHHSCLILTKKFSTSHHNLQILTILRRIIIYVGLVLFIVSLCNYNLY